MDRAEAYIGNSQKFQKTVEEFITRSDERAQYRAEKEQEDKKKQEQKDKRRAHIHYTLLGGLISLFVGFILLAVQWATNFEKRHHVTENPSVSSQQHAKEE